MRVWHSMGKNPWCIYYVVRRGAVRLGSVRFRSGPSVEEVRPPLLTCNIHTHSHGSHV